ncbi:MAG: uroporphyrinogen-III C-methyltransferase [Chlorobiaceae bacterium]|nr:uroporphyrinogen-III C-methyltransferase [Chlorobiaceae bacterium]
MRENKQKNPVLIVGTGPGDPELLTVKGDRAIRNADVILYDCKTVEPALLVASATATVIAVERSQYESGEGCREETPMIRSIRDHYLGGRKVVRLKAGDPTLFGGEVDECDLLDQLGIPYAIVPGVSAGAAAACAYAMPISRKFESDAVVNIIVNEVNDELGSLLRNGAKMFGQGATMVLYMATANLPVILGIFSEEGVPDDTPVVAVSKAGWPEEAMVETTLGAMGAEGFSLGISEPVVYTIGRYVRVRISPFESRKRSAIFSKCLK